MELIGNSNEMTNEEAECLQIVYDMIGNDEKLKPMRKFYKEEFLLMPIRSYGCNPSSVFRVIKYLQTYSTETYPDLFSKVNVGKLKHVLDKKLYEIVTPYSNDSPGIMILRIKRWKPSEVSPDQVLAAGMLCVYQMAKSFPGIQKNGVVMIQDIDGFCFSHARQVSYDLGKKLMYCLTFASPIRIIGHIAINSHALFEKVYSVMKFVVPEKVRKDIHIVKKDLTPLHNMVPERKMLPLSLGGEIPDDLGFVKGLEEEAMKDHTLQNLFANLQHECSVERKNY